MNCMNLAKLSCKILQQIANCMVEEKKVRGRKLLKPRLCVLQTFSRIFLLVHLIEEWNKDAIRITQCFQKVLEMSEGG